MKKYRSPYEAYPFLSEDSQDLRCDFEIATDRYASQVAQLAADCPDYEGDLLTLAEWIYHANPSLRTFFSLKKEEIDQLKQKIEDLNSRVQDRYDRFVLPAGSVQACQAHVLRSEAKSLIRLVYRHIEQTSESHDRLIDFLSLVSHYFFLLAMELNRLDGIDERPFISRNYPDH